MSASTIFIIAVTAVAAVVVSLWLFRRAAAPKAAADEGQMPAKREQSRQWGVRIAAPATGRTCPPVRALLGKEFPLADRPPLPLPDCAIAPQCECRYVRLFDRRHEDRRAGGERRSKGARYEKDKLPRRSGQDRRGKVDWF
jgi:hypothetical protein